MSTRIIGSLARKPLPCLLHYNLCPIASSLFTLPGNRRDSVRGLHINGHDRRYDGILLPSKYEGGKIGNRSVNQVRSRHSRSKSDRDGSTFLRTVPSYGEIVVKRLLPKSVVPYAQLMRLDKPTGTLLLLWPSYWSILLATEAGHTPDLTILSLFMAGAILMRGAGCTINDLWDKKYDAQVARTKDRPLASGKIKTLPALFFLAGQLSTALYILTRFDNSSIFLGASSMLLVVTYPLAKRYTHWAQLILGMTFNWGALLGYSVVKGGLNFDTSQNGLMDAFLQSDLAAVLPLYIAGISWTLIYDTIYAHQDKVDDLIIGLKSTAIRFGDQTKPWLAAFSVSMVTSLAASGIMTSQTWPYYVSVGIIGGHLFNQIKTLDINDPNDCWKKFKNNSYIGFILASGIFISTLFKEDEKVDTDTG